MSKGRLQHLKMETKQQRDARRDRPPYPMTRKFNVMRALFSRDFRMSIYLFGLFQMSIVVLILSATTKYSKSLFVVAMIMAFTAAIHGYREALQRQRVKFKTTPLSPFRLLGFLIGSYLIIYIISMVINILGIEIPIQENQAALEKVLETHFIPMSFITVVVAPIVEELTFREYIPHAFGPSYASFIISAMIFALLHSPTGIVGFTIYMTLSMIFLYVRLKDNNIMTVIFLHMSYNLLSLVLSQMVLYLAK